MYIKNNSNLKKDEKIMIRSATALSGCQNKKTIKQCWIEAKVENITKNYATVTTEFYKTSINFPILSKEIKYIK